MRALLSVWDKTGLVELADGLSRLGVELVASGGTSSELGKAGLEHLPVEELTGWPEMLSGRVKTLHPAIHAGILADRSRREHMRDLARHDLSPIDLVVCNLYPFASDPSVELIDVGGPTMVRAAAKNFAHVGVIVRPADYGPVLEELAERGSLSQQTRHRLAEAAFAHTAAYDSSIATWLASSRGRPGAASPVGAASPIASETAASSEARQDDVLPEVLELTLRRREVLRYGENPHQRGARYAFDGEPGWWDGVVQHSGVALSYLNIFDAEAAWQLVTEASRHLGPVACAVVKHASPCGLALADAAEKACAEALAADPVSAFGGILALSAPMTPEAAAAVVAGAQLDVIVAPSYGPGVVETLARRRRNTRVLEAPSPRRPRRDLRSLDGGFLVQETDAVGAGREGWTVVTRRQPSDSEWADVELAWLACARTGSNAIVVARSSVVVGVGAGQQNRLDSARIATAKAGSRAVGAAGASDAFFPFRDGLDALADAGVTAVVQPGGSVRDGEVIAAADERGLAMVLTGERHFRH